VSRPLALSLSLTPLHSADQPSSGLRAPRATVVWKGPFQLGALPAGNRCSARKHLRVTVRDSLPSRQAHLHPHSHHGKPIKPRDRYRDDQRWMISAEYGGTGGQPLQGGMCVEEPDIEIGQGLGFCR
jgi:hypothetical protein